MLLRRERLRRMRPADAVAARLGVEWPDDAARHQADRLLATHPAPALRIVRCKSATQAMPPRLPAA